MQMSLYTLIGLTFCGLCFQAYFIYIEHKEEYVGAVIFKGLASLMFIILGFGGLAVVVDRSFGKLVVAGLILGGIGDVLLNLRFVFKDIGQKIFLVGILAFLAGHIVYLVALIPLSSSLLWGIIAGVIAAVGILVWIFKNITANKVFKIFGIFYIGAVVLMTAVAIGNVITYPTKATCWIYALGAILFTASDIVLIFNTFGGEEPKFSMRIANLSLYYVGQLLIALSLQAFN